jgi:hypothetical protein
MHLRASVVFTDAHFVRDGNRFGHIDISAQAKMRSALRTDTPT